MLAYLTATGLSDDFLIYTGIKTHDETILIEHSEKKIHVVSIDISAHNAKRALLDRMSHALRMWKPEWSTLWRSG